MSTWPGNVNVPPSDPTPALPPPVAPVPAELGVTTSEYSLVKLAAAAVAVANAALGVASAFGAHITPAEMAAIFGFEGSVVGLVGTYTIGRSVRKRGTPR